MCLFQLLTAYRLRSAGPSDAMARACRFDTCMRRPPPPGKKKY